MVLMSQLRAEAECSESSDGNNGVDHMSSEFKETEKIVEPEAENQVTTWYRVWILGEYRDLLLTWSRRFLLSCLTMRILPSDGEGTDDLSKQGSNIFHHTSLPWKRDHHKAFEFNGEKIEVVWDCSKANYSSNPEPTSSFYLVVVCRGEVVLRLGDLHLDISSKLGQVVDSNQKVKAQEMGKRIHVYGRKECDMNVQLSPDGGFHRVHIRCEREGSAKIPSLTIFVNNEVKVQVSNLTWDFRGNQVTTVDGKRIRVFWDVYNWLFGTTVSHAYFTFCTSPCEWDNCVRFEDSFRRSTRQLSFPLEDDEGSIESIPSVRGSDEQDAGYSLSVVSWRHDLRVYRTN